MLNTNCPASLDGTQQCDMKFARCLQDTQTPEWKKAYIDYYGLKIQLGVMRAQNLQQIDTSSSFRNTNADYSAPNIEVDDDDSDDPASHGGDSMRWRAGNQEIIPSFSLAMASLPRMTRRAMHGPQQTPPPSRARRSPVLPRFENPGSPTPPPLRTLLSNLPATHAKFFDMLDAELNKVVTFYAEREKEMHERSKMLKKQLNELAIHRQKFYELSTHSKRQSWFKRAYLSVLPTLSPLTKWFRSFSPKPEDPCQIGRNKFLVSEYGRSGRFGFVDPSNLGMRAPDRSRCSGDHSGPRRRDAVKKGPGNAYFPWALNDSARMPPGRSDNRSSVPFGSVVSSHDPHAYKYAKRRLRKAVAEHYRLHSNSLDWACDERWTIIRAMPCHDPLTFRNKILNLAGFRKILRKYGKITKTFVLDAYMKEKVEPSVLASGAVVSTLLKEVEHLFAMRFERGNKKKAKDHLRVGPSSKKQDFGSLSFGFWLGLAVPAIAAGCYLSLQEYTRKTLPSWNILLLLYSVFTLPILMALLVGFNIVVWARNGINYVFIFKLDPRLRHDHQDYFELPSFLLCTLAYGFWFSMAQLGPPMLWPLLWVVITLATMFNPLQSVMWGDTRWWTIKKVAKLFVSGMWNVEFVDLWLGDQCCSLVYTFSNLYSFGCFYSSANLHFLAYDQQAQEVWSKCGIVPNWGFFYLLGMLPFLARFVQSLRRYRDSKMYSQLLNAGKYAVGLIHLFFYYYWRHHEAPRGGKSYVLFCVASVFDSLYGFAWDVAVDWSMCQPYARYPLLRRELIYESHLIWYYFALVSDMCIRFIWLLYIFFESLSLELRLFIVAFLEVLRRVQWSFYRVENKHVHNAEEYRIIRELSMPYMFDASPGEEESHIARLQLKKRLARLS